jgi:hypothetical protein
VDSTVVLITEKLLSGAGGWQAMKTARELVKAGRVSAATYEPPLLAGEVRDGQTNYRAGLRIRTAGEIENICARREARVGKIARIPSRSGWSILPAFVAESACPAKSRRQQRPLCFVSETDARPIALFILPLNFRGSGRSNR